MLYAMKYSVFLLILFCGCTLFKPQPKQPETVVLPGDSVTIRNQLLQRTNQIRAEYGTPALVLSDSLNNLAMEYALELSNDCSTSGQVHSYKQGVGENLYWRMFYTTPLDAVECWEREKEYYTPKTKLTAQIASKAGHYTSMVSRRSKQAGFGWVKCASGSIIVVAYYYPAGNVIGEIP